MLTHPSFKLDERIASTCIELGDWPLCQVLLKNTADYPWLILVPREINIRDIDDLSQVSQHQLMNEITKISTIVKRIFNPDKLNIGTLGNIVPQLHIHVIARFTQDKLWPQGVWQSAHTDTPYIEDTLKALVRRLQSVVQSENSMNQLL